MKNKHHISLLLVVSVLSLTSCSIQTNMIHPDSLRYSPAVRPQISSSDGSYAYSADNHSIEPFPTFTPDAADDPKLVKGKKLVKRTVCAAFIVPPMPAAPRVDMSVLSNIPADDHEAVKRLLIDNIRSMNQHYREVEVQLKEAYRKHRASCVIRDVLM